MHRRHFDKTYASSLNHIVILRNHNTMSTDPGQNPTSSSSSKVIYKRRRWDSSACTTDKKMPVLVPVALLDATVVMRKHQRRVKGKKDSDLSGKVCSGTLDPCLETKNLVQKGTPEVKDNNHLEDEKHVKVSENATENCSQEGTTGTTNGCVGKGISDDFGEEDGKVEVIPVSLNAPVPGHGGTKLLVLDLNGLLVDIRQANRVGKKSDFRVNGKPAFKRPFCDDFLRFCFQNFKIGIWSSRKRQYVTKVVDIIMGDLKHDILFCWDQSECTETGCRALENVHKQLLFKDLRKIWERTGSNLPFEKGEYSPSNTLLVDDSPYKALCNPPHTAIFPVPYSFDDADDNSLGPGGKLRCYLEGLIKADDVQCYVRDNPFGQPAISYGHDLWDFYSKILENLDKKKTN
ncbi:putative FCP1 homology domain-containing protein C1271.03c [Carex rostrata]